MARTGVYGCGRRGRWCRPSTCQPSRCGAFVFSGDDAANDGCVRVFTRDPAREASQEVQTCGAPDVAAGGSPVEAAAAGLETLTEREWAILGFSGRTE